MNGVPVRFVDLRIVDGAATNGGGVYSAAGKLTFVRTTVSGNVASNAGGGIAATAPVVLQNSLVTGNKVVQSSSGPQVMGGGISATAVTLTRSTVRSNLAHAIGAANPTRAYGGGIFLTGAGSLVAKRSHIDKNTARANGPSATALGGGVAQQSGSGPALRFTDSTLNGNKALGNAIVGTGFVQGGAVQAGRVRASRTEFVGNRIDLTAALGSGNASGGALLLGSTASTFTSVEIRKTRVEVDAATNALLQGGGIATGTPSAKLTIARSTISGGTATVHSTNSTATAYGGGIHSPGDLVLVGSTVAGNSLAASSSSGNATAAGGGVRAEDTLSVQTSTISGNSIQSIVGNAQATSLGGGISLVTSPQLATVVNSTVTKNSAKAIAITAGLGPIAVGYGGGIYIANSTLRLTNATVARNSATANGALSAPRRRRCVRTTATLELRGSILAANTATVRADCDGLTTSLGYNLIGSRPTLHVTTKASDKTNKAAKLGAFGDHGGPTRRSRSSPAARR